MKAAGRGWSIAALLAISACATPPPKPVEPAARAATHATDEGPPECGAPNADTLEDGLVVIRPGQTICIAATSWGNVVTLVRVVPSSSTDGAARPIILRSWRDGSDVFLTIRNPYSRYLKYRAGVVLPGEVR